MQHRPRFTFPTDDWSPNDRTGAPLDDVLDELRRRHPDLWVERLTAVRKGDDHNVYFIGGADLRHIVQVDTDRDGRPPFIIEADDRVSASEPAETVDAIEARLSPSE